MRDRHGQGGRQPIQVKAVQPTAAPGQLQPARFAVVFDQVDFDPGVPIGPVRARQSVTVGQGLDHARQGVQRGAKKRIQPFVPLRAVQRGLHRRVVEN
ncbi:MAG: hypothetical protein KDA41_10270, partial [Planctomycetales bacterium]|nr:hypothetical protein [Planctomycetales bacterium]